MWIAVHQSNESYGSDRSFSAVIAAIRSRFGEGLLVGPLHAPAAVADGRTLWRLPKVYRSMFTPRGMLSFCLAALSSTSNLLLQRRFRRRFIAVNTLALAPLVVIARLLGLRPVVFVREIIDDRPLLGRVLLFLAVMPASLVICNSRATRDWVESHCGRRRWVRAVHNGVTIPEGMSPVAFNRDMRMVFVGRVSPNKGIDLAIRALADLATEYPALRLTVAGGPAPGGEAYVDVLTQAADAVGVGDRIDFLGFREDAVAHFYGARVALVPSRFSEPFGRTAVEAMLCGAPVVAARVGGLPEIIEDGVSGLLFERESVDDLVAKIRLLLSDEARRLEIASNGRRRALARFSERAMCRRVSLMVERVVRK